MRCLFMLGFGLLTSSVALGQTSSLNNTLNNTLNNAFLNHNYATVSKIAHENNSQETLNTLNVWANKGSVPAMWLLALKLYNDNQEQASANWVYTAVLGMRLDISGCLNTDVDQEEKVFLNAYWPIVQSARVLPSRMATAIDYSIRFFKENNLKTYDPAWVCKLKPEWNHQGLMFTDPLLTAHRKWAFKEYVRGSSASSLNDENSDILSSDEMKKELINSGD